MRAAAIVPVKRFEAAKSRLGAALDERWRAGLALAMAEDVLTALARCRRLDPVLVVSGEPGAHRLAERLGMRALDDPEDRGHSEAGLLGLREAARADLECAMLLSADCPLLDPREIDAALDDVPAPPFVGVIADRHGTGTNGLLLRPPCVMAPAFGPDSRARHLEAAERAGATAKLITIPSLELDLDTPEDLAELRPVIEREPARAPATAGALRRLRANGARA